MERAWGFSRRGLGKFRVETGFCTSVRFRVEGFGSNVDQGVTFLLGLRLASASLQHMTSCLPKGSKCRENTLIESQTLLHFSGVAY